MSESFIYSSGLGNVPSYQVSGIPWVSGGISATTIKSVSFPYVTRWIYVVNNGTGDLKVGFSQNGVQGTRYFTVQASGTAGKDTTTIRLEVKATELWFSGSTSVDIVAGLTTIPVARINNSSISPSGSNWSGSANV
jgi:hypothetical protein